MDLWGTLQELRVARGSDLKSEVAASKNTTDGMNSVQNKHKPVKAPIGQWYGKGAGL